LVNFIKLGETRQALETLDEMLESHQASTLLTVPAVKIMKLNLINTMVNTLYEISPYVEDSLLQTLNPVRRLLSCNQIAEIKQEMSKIVIQLCDYFSFNRKDETNELKDAAIIYL